MTTGAVSSPAVAALAARGLRTLASSPPEDAMAGDVFLRAVSEHPESTASERLFTAACSRAAQQARLRPEVARQGRELGLRCLVVGMGSALAPALYRVARAMESEPSATDALVSSLEDSPDAVERSVYGLFKETNMTPGADMALLGTLAERYGRDVKETIGRLGQRIFSGLGNDERSCAFGRALLQGVARHGLLDATETAVCGAAARAESSATDLNDAFSMLAQGGELEGSEARRSLARLTLRASIRQNQLLMRYFPQHAQEALTSTPDGESQLGGTRKRAAVLFSDLRGFTSLSEKLEAEEVVALLNQVFEPLTHAVEKAGGEVNDFIADAMLAVFYDDGDGTAPLRAVQAASDMQRELEILRKTSDDPNLADLHMGIGIHSGELVEGNIGTPGRLKRAVIGDTVNVAARLEGRSRDGRHTCILMSDEVYGDVRDQVEADFFGAETLKGKGGPMNVWELRGERLPEGLRE